MQKTGIKIDRQRAAIGIILVICGVAVPGVFSYGASGIGKNLQLAAAMGQSSYVLAAALRLVFLNSLRSFPHYLGTFLIVKSIRMENKELQLVKTLVLPIVIIAGVYFAVERIYGIEYNFAVPALLMLSVIFAVDRLDFTMVSITKEVLMLVMIIFAIQFSDVMPALPSTMFGRGEISMNIKTMAELMSAEQLLQRMSMLFMGIFAFSALILGLQINLENQLRKAKKATEEEREKYVDTRMRLIDARINKEQQFLVHDLKAPLTSIQIWTDLLRMKAGDGLELSKDQSGAFAREIEENCAACNEYIDHVDGSIKHMNMLISEIMNAKAKNAFTVNDVVKLFSSQTSPAYYNGMMRVENSCGEVKTELNRTNFVRALINLTENAAHSIHHDHGEIKLTVNSDGSTVSFTVSDNGDGIREDMLDKIFEEGVSGKNSSGVGLCFVKEVVKELGGEVSIKSTLGEGTAVTLNIPIYLE